MNPALEFVLSLAEEGYHPSVIIIEPHEGEWRCRVCLSDTVPLGEGGNVLRGQSIKVDRSNLPKGVSIEAWERCEDQCIDLGQCNDEVAETWVREIAEAGKAPDYAKLRDYWLTKPIEWLKEPIRSALLRKHNR